MLNVGSYIYNNNLNYVRLILSTAVIYSHSYVLAPVPGAADFIVQLLGFTNLGSLAVKVFFFVSGLLVCNSLLNNSNPVRYIVSRSFRIIPALFVLLLLTVFVMGPIITHSDHYFGGGFFLSYFLGNLNLFTSAHYFLPGVFLDNPYPGVVNGSLWTLNIEVMMYAFLIVFSLLGIVRFKMLFAMLLVFVIFMPLYRPGFYTYFFTGNPEVYELPACFASGCLLALYKEKVLVSPFILLGLILLAYFNRGGLFFSYFFYFSIFYAVIYFSDRRVFNFLPDLKTDISYGVYIYGFVIQQLVVYFWPGEDYLFNTVVSVLIVYPIAFASCKLIEEPCIALGKSLVSGYLSGSLSKRVS